MYTNKQSKLTNKKLLAISALLVIALALGGFLVYKSQRANQVATQDNPSGAEKLDLGPPTEEEKNEADLNKERLVKEKEAQEQQEPTAGDNQQVTPRIGYLRQADNKNIEANGYVGEIIEADGTCILALEKDGKKVSQSKQARPDAQSTICGLITVERNRLEPGEWRATLSYSSAQYQGTSSEMVIKVE